MSGSVRIIARLDVKGSSLIKGVNLEGLRIVGDPKLFAQNYYENGIDELLYMDVVASLYGRNNLKALVEHTAEHVFVPLTVGGGVRSIQDIQQLLNSGADRVAINTAAIKNPSLIEEASRCFGSQCIVLSIEAKRIQSNQPMWEALYENGRERSGLNVVEWVKKGEALGAGEILLTSVDKEGTKKGFDVELIQAVSEAVSIPVIASGGFSKPTDFIDAVNKGGASAVAIADAFHYQRYSVDDIRHVAKSTSIPVRSV